MRYNPDTERGLTLEAIGTSIPNVPSLCPEPAQVWDCSTGRGWIPNPALPLGPVPPPERGQALSEDDRLEGEATLQLWGARYKLQQITAGSIPAATVASLKRDVADIARELQRLS